MGAEQISFFAEPSPCSCGGSDAAKKTRELSGCFDRLIALCHEFLNGGPISGSNRRWNRIAQGSGVGSLAAIAVATIFPFLSKVLE